MASLGFAIECPNCGRSAFEENFYKTDETYIICYRCGYNYRRIMKEEFDGYIEHEEMEFKGFGVILLTKKNQMRELIMINDPMKEGEIEAYKAKFTDDDVDLENSYFVTFKDGEFSVLLGTPSENFHLSFKDYKKKMLMKYEDHDEDMDLFVPIEE